MINFLQQYRFLVVPILVWIAIQSFKVMYDLAVTKKFNFKRIMGAGGMPSSHSAVVTSLATMVGKNYGTDSAIFAIAVIFAFIVKAKKMILKISFFKLIILLLLQLLLQLLLV